MKQLIRCFSRVADDSSHYALLRSKSSKRRCSLRRTDSKVARRAKGVPEGHVPLYVGDEMERFVVSAKVLNHPVFIGLLNKSAQEYGYDQKGALRIPCHVRVFERVMESLRLGVESRELDELVESLIVDEILVKLDSESFFSS